MTTTTFAELHPYIRAILGDTDKMKPMYAADVLNQHMRLLILQQNNPEYQESGTTAKYTNELPQPVQAQTIYSVAKAIVIQIPNNFSYRTPVFAVSRSGFGAQLLAYIDEQLDAIVGGGGGAYLEYDTELGAILNNVSRFYDSYIKAINEG